MAINYDTGRHVFQGTAARPNVDAVSNSRGGSNSPNTGNSYAATSLDLAQANNFRGNQFQKGWGEATRTRNNEFKNNEFQKGWGQPNQFRGHDHQGHQFSFTNTISNSGQNGSTGHSRAVG